LIGLFSQITFPLNIVVGGSVTFADFDFVDVAGRIAFVENTQN
jgi:hypothetical protein